VAVATATAAPQGAVVNFARSWVVSPWCPLPWSRPVGRCCRWAEPLPSGGQLLRRLLGPSGRSHVKPTPARRCGAPSRTQVVGAPPRTRNPEGANRFRPSELAASKTRRPLRLGGIARHTEEVTGTDMQRIAEGSPTQPNVRAALVWPWSKGPQTRVSTFGSTTAKAVHRDACQPGGNGCGLSACTRGGKGCGLSLKPGRGCGPQTWCPSAQPATSACAAAAPINMNAGAAAATAAPSAEVTSFFLRLSGVFMTNSFLASGPGWAALTGRSADHT
jgi:hypothetical protein